MPKKYSESISIIKYAFLLFFNTLFSLFLIGCSLSDYKQNDGVSTSIPHVETSVETSVEISESIEINEHILKEMAWREAYKTFLENILSKGTDETYFSLRDLDSDGIPELILEQIFDDQSYNPIINIYSFRVNIYKIDEYKLKSAGGLLVSDKANYPGLFHCTWGGGVEDYWYLFVKQSKLVTEHVLRIDRNGKSEEQTNISHNNKLVEETINIFQSAKIQNNLLEMFPANDDKIDEILGK